MKVEKSEHLKQLSQINQYAVAKINQTSKSKNNIVSLNQNDFLVNKKKIQPFPINSKLNPEKTRPSLDKVIAQKNNNRTFNLEVSTAGQVYHSDLLTNLNTNTATNSRVKDYLNSKLGKVQKISPTKNQSNNESQLRSCLENYIKNSRKMRNLSENQQMFKSFHKGQTRESLGNKPINLSGFQQYVSFNEIFRKKQTSTKNSNISSLNNSINDKMKKNFNSNTVLSGANERIIKSNTATSFNNNVRNVANTDLKRNLSYLCEGSINQKSDSHHGTASELKSNNSNLITKCNSKQKINGETNTNANSTPNYNLASPFEEKDATISSPGQPDSSRIKVKIIKQNLMDLLKKKGTNPSIMCELETIYKNLINKNTVSHASSSTLNLNNEMELLDFNQLESANASTNEITKLRGENLLLRKENAELKVRLDMIDKKFDRIIQENENLKTIIQNKSENFENLQNYLAKFEKTLEDIKQSSLANKKLDIQFSSNKNNSAQQLNNKKVAKQTQQPKAGSNNKPTNPLLNSLMANPKSKPSMPYNNIPQGGNKKNQHKATKSIGNAGHKLSAQLKFAEASEEPQFSELESLSYSTLNIDNPKELFYLPQKVVGNNTGVPKSVPKLNMQEIEQPYETNTDQNNIEDEELAEPQHVEEYGTFQSNALDKAFMTNDSIALSEKKVCIDDLSEGAPESSAYQKKNELNESSGGGMAKGAHKQQFSLNFENLPRADYHEEFIAQMNDFSPSWRLACEKMQKGKPKN